MCDKHCKLTYISVEDIIRENKELRDQLASIDWDHIERLRKLTDELEIMEKIHEEALRLLFDGRWDDALAKFEESKRHDSPLANVFIHWIVTVIQGDTLKSKRWEKTMSKDTPFDIIKKKIKNHPYSWDCIFVLHWAHKIGLIEDDITLEQWECLKDHKEFSLLLEKEINN